MSMMLVIAVSLAGGATAYFGIMWLSSRRVLKSMTSVEYAIAEMHDDRARRARPSLRQRLSSELVARGYRGGLGPVLGLVALTYLAAVTALTLLGIRGVPSLIMAAAVVVGGAFTGIASAGARRQKAFNGQLSQMFTMLAGQLEAGTSLQRALPSVAANLQDPLRGELQAAISGGASVDLLAAADQLAARYPSRAMTLFQAALQVDNDLGGGRLAGTLTQLAQMVDREKELAEEALGTLAETKAEFNGIIAVLLSIVVFTISSQVDNFKSPLVLAAVGVGAGNFAFGVFRTRRMLAKVSK